MYVRTAQTDLTHDVGAPRAGRRFVSLVLAEWCAAPGVVERAQLLVSELISNAVLHGAGPVRLVLAEVDSGLSVRIEVCNSGSGQPLMRRAQPDELSGRGLQLVDQLARGWGSSRGDGETSVWFEVRIDADEPGAWSSRRVNG